MTSWQVLQSLKQSVRSLVKEFIRIFEEEAKKIGAVDFLAQGNHLSRCGRIGLGGESAVISLITM